MPFQTATRYKSKARVCIMGPTGARKTKTALRLAKGLSTKPGSVYIIDTERGRARLFAKDYPFNTDEWMEDFRVEGFISRIREAEAAGAEVIIVDSYSAAWSGKGGILSQKDELKKGERAGEDKNDFALWGKITPKHLELLDTILTCKAHVICTLRQKMTYELVKDENTGKNKPQRVGLKPMQRDDVEYEFAVVMVMDADHVAHVVKTPDEGMQDQYIEKPGEDIGERMRVYFDDGEEPPPFVPRTQMLGQMRERIAELKTWEEYGAAREEVEKWEAHLRWLVKGDFQKRHRWLTSNVKRTAPPPPPKPDATPAEPPAPKPDQPATPPPAPVSAGGPPTADEWEKRITDFVARFDLTTLQGDEFKRQRKAIESSAPEMTTFIDLCVSERKMELQGKKA